MRLLQRLDLQRDAGLAQKERFGGARDAATFGDGAEDLELVQIHKHPFVLHGRNCNSFLYERCDTIVNVRKRCDASAWAVHRRCFRMLAAQ